MKQGQIRLDKKTDVGPQVDELKKKFNQVQTQAKTFMVNHKHMKAKERAQKLQEIQKAFEGVQRDLDKFRSQPLTNTGVKFALESFRNTYNAFLPRWKKFEDEFLGSTD